MATTAIPRRRRLRRVLWIALVVIVLAVAAILVLGGARIANLMRSPDAPFDPRAAPPAPDYARPDAWLAYPGRDGLERSAPAGLTPIDEAQAPVDVFFIHPTTFSDNTVWNAAYDAPDDMAKLNPVVLMAQASAFNGCCRIYAPHYRQATLAGLGNRPAFELAYSDVARAFRHFIARESKGRPFIIASHSQGTGHAIELLQKEIRGTALKDRMVAAYLIGGYVPRDFATAGLPTCDSARATGCVVTWNASKGWRPARMVIEGKPHWWQGAVRSRDLPRAICVDPLTWRADGAGPASANEGSLPFPQAPYPTRATTLPALVPHLTGAACRDQMLEVDIPWSAPEGFSDPLSRLLGSYHLNDYGLFYGNLRGNAIERVAAWQAAHPAK
jgi:hypothetical protein